MKTCLQCNMGFEVTDDDRTFYTKMDVTEPTLCPDCRQQRRLSFRNERNLYRDTCDLCKKSMVSLYSPESPFKVYCQECWWGDQWDPLQYGMDVNFSKPFFEQWRELQLQVPRLALFNMHSENSTYTNHSFDNKNCYMGVAMGGDLDCLYGHWVLSSADTVDALYCDQCTECYEISYCLNAYRTFFSEFCDNTKECWFCFECVGSENCIGCTQLQHKKNYIFNQPVSEEAFQKFKNEMMENPSKFREVAAQFKTIKEKTPRRFARMINCQNCLGNDLRNCKNVSESFNCRNVEDSRHMYDLSDVKDGMDCYEYGWFVKSELAYECHAGMAGFNFRFTNICAESRDLTCCDCCFNNSSNLFGCIGLKHRSYCILNKQYSKEEYEKLVPKIIEHMKKPRNGKRAEWGEFFPAAYSPFAYNETPAQEYYPLTKGDATTRGLKWRDHLGEPHTVEKVIPASRLPNQITEVPDDILNWAIECELTGRPFRIVEQELKFYRKMGLPIPHFHPDERHFKRMALRNPRKLWKRTCAQCQTPFDTSYSPDRPEIVLCEFCYLKTVY